MSQASSMVQSFNILLVNVCWLWNFWSNLEATKHIISLICHWKMRQLVWLIFFIIILIFKIQVLFFNISWEVHCDMDRKMMEISHFYFLKGLIIFLIQFWISNLITESYRFIKHFWRISVILTNSGIFLKLRRLK